MNIYADNAATTQMSKTAIRAMLPYMDKVYGNPSSLHSMGQRATEAMAEARKNVAVCLGCDAGEIEFTSGGSESDNQAIFSAARSGERAGKKHIISTVFEHHAVLNTLKKLEKRGFEITLLPVREKGIVSAEQVSAAIRPDTCLVSVMYANNEIGTVQPVREIGTVCREKKILFHTDAVQAAGHLEIDVHGDNIDMLSLSGHKFHGPKGVGVLYTRRGVALSPLIEGGAQEKGKRAGTENVPAIVGLSAALCESCKMLGMTVPHQIKMRDRLIDGLLEIPHSVLNGDREKRLPGNVNMCFEGIEGESILLLLDDAGICASSGSACTSGSLEPSHVLLAIGRPPEIAHGSLRLTIDENISDEEIDYIINAVKKVVSRLRDMSPAWHDLCKKKKFYLNKE